MSEKTIEELLKEYVPGEFKPHYYATERTLTIYFKGDADYSEKIADNVTLYRAIDTKEIVGCRIELDKPLDIKSE